MPTPYSPRFRRLAQHFAPSWASNPLTVPILLLSLFASGLLGNPPAIARAPEKTKAEKSADSKRAQADKRSDTKAKREDWFSKWVRGQQFYKFRKNAPQVRHAFNEVTKQAAKATVQILCDQHPTVLGLVVDKSGYIVTKASELKGTIEVRFDNGDTVPASIVGAERRNDLALLKVEHQPLTAAKWSDSSTPPVGSWVIAPAPGAGTLAVGVVSTTPRWVRGGVLGVFLEPSPAGPRIVAVNPKGGGGRAGLRRGDVITKVNGKEVADVDAAIHAIGSYLPGETVKVHLQRGDQEIELEAKLDSIHESFNNKRAQFQNSLGTELSDRRAGFPNAFEHDLNLPPNQCGGPLVDIKGRVIGINIARAGRVSSFAIPGQTAIALIADMKAGKYSADTAVAQHGQHEELETVEANSSSSDMTDGSD